MLSGFGAYLDSVKARDPAPRSRWEILLYPGVWALGFHRVAHWLFGGELYFLARLVNHMARFFTAICPRVYRFTPFRMTKAQRESIHGHDEHIGVEDFLAGVRWYARLLERLEP